VLHTAHCDAPERLRGARFAAPPNRYVADPPCTRPRLVDRCVSRVHQPFLLAASTPATIAADAAASMLPLIR
jgi:hypothetical protein